MLYIYDNKNMNLLGEYPVIEVVNEDGTITLDVEATRAYLPTNITEVTPLEKKEGFDVLFNKDAGEWYYSDIYIKPNLKNTGDVYTLNDVDYKVPFMKDDADGLMQVKTAFDLGIVNTVIHFTNGTKMPIKSTEFEAFAIWFVGKRNSFFVEQLEQGGINGN